MDDVAQWVNNNKIKPITFLASFEETNPKRGDILLSKDFFSKSLTFFTVCILCKFLCVFREEDTVLINELNHTTILEKGFIFFK